MIRMSLEPRKLIVDQPNELSFQLTNIGNKTLTNLVLKITLPSQIVLLKGGDRIEARRLDSTQSITHSIHVRPRQTGTWILGSSNFSYQDGLGQSQRINDLRVEVTAEPMEPTPVLPKPKISIQLTTKILPWGQWETLDGQVVNKGPLDLKEVLIRVVGRVTCSENMVNLGALTQNNAVEFRIPVRANESGSKVPIEIETIYTDIIDRTGRFIESTTLRVKKSAVTPNLYDEIDCRSEDIRTDECVSRQIEYDVAFSFADEQRHYVQETKEALLARGVRVFYDHDETSELWGKDLYQSLSEIYLKMARYCVLFLSRDYANKRWTKHELKNIQARAFQESREYLLPARFDDTEIPGLLPTIAYVDLRVHEPKEFADIIISKINGNSSMDEQSKDIDPKLEAYLAEAVIQAEEYLRPQPLETADQIARIVRRSFELARGKPTDSSVIPYLRNEKPTFRVVGYLAFQIHPLHSLLPDLVNCLTRERRLASEQKETRPLWQLLMCFTELLSKELDSKSRGLIQDALRLHQDFLHSDPSVDPGGECKSRIEMLLS